MFQRGSMIRIRRADQILATLDEHGMLGGIPFVPQMVEYCGRLAKVQSKAGAVCASNQETAIRRMDDTYVLEVPRCNGHSKVACDAGCTLLWKEAWLEAAYGSDSRDVPSSSEVSHQAAVAEITRLNEAAAGRFGNSAGRCVCQATELWRSSAPMPVYDVGQYLREQQSNRTSWRGIFGALSETFATKVKKVIRRRETVAGTLRKTPSTDTKLAANDLVRVKTQEQIEATLDRQGRNRGLWFDPEMLQFCGRTMRVSRVIEQVIDESSGELRKFRHPTVVLEEEGCSGLSHRFCSRRALFYWRAVWLETSEQTSDCSTCPLHANPMTAVQDPTAKQNLAEVV